MAEVFVSYSREDQARVAALVHALQQHGLGVFWDRQIPPGRTWREYIGVALAEARCVIVAWSRYSVSSEFVAEEADDARRRGVLVPVLIDDVLPPLGFRGLQAADLCGLQADSVPPGIDAIVRAVGELVRRRPHAPESDAAAPVPSSGKIDPRRRRLWPLLAFGAAAGLVLAAGLGWRSATHEAPAVVLGKGPDNGAARAPASAARIVDAWRSEAGGIELKVLIHNRETSTLTVETIRAFGLVGAGPRPQPPTDPDQPFQVLDSGQMQTFNLRFARLEGARALRVTLPGQVQQDLPLPPLR